MSMRIHKVSLSIIVLSAWCMGLFGQEIMITNLSPPSGPLTPQTLTMSMVTNTGSTTQTGYLEAELQDGNLNPVATLRSANFRLDPGQQLSYTSIPWSSQVRYGSSAAGNTLRTRGLLQSGDFLICHAFYAEDAVEVARDCAEKRAELNINFSLIYPQNGSLVREARPTLVWENVSQFGLNSGSISYELTVVELYQGQSAAEALERNVTLLRQRNLRSASLFYPEGARALELNRTYAWMVRVFQGQDEVLVSPPWRFSLTEASEAIPELSNASYVMPSHDIDNRAYPFGPFIHVAFDNNEGLERLTYTITSLSDQKKIDTGLPVVDDLHSGLNTIDIPTATMKLRSGEVYRLTIESPRKRDYFLHFRYEAK